MSNPLDLIIGGLGGVPQPPAGAARAWDPANAAGPVPPMIDMSKPAGTLFVSIMEGKTLRITVEPANPEAYIALACLPTRVQRAGAFGVSFHDLPGVYAVAASIRHEVKVDAAVQDLVDRWTKWCLELEYIKSFAQYPDFHVPGLDIDFIDFQARGVHYLVKIRSALCGDQMGTGKSIQTLGTLFTHRIALGGNLPTVILSPTSVVGDWHAKFRKFAKMEVAVADGTKSRRQKVYEKRPEFLVMSYDTFIRDAAEMMNFIKPVAFVADEAQRFTNRKTKVAERIIEFTDITDPKFKIPMSGSPISNRPDDLWPIMRLINRELAGPARNFEKRYLKEEVREWEPKEGGGMKPKVKTYHGRSFIPMRLVSLNPKIASEAARLEELRGKVAPYVIRRLKKNVLINLPSKFHERLEVILGPVERKAYEELQARLAESMAGVHDEDLHGEETSFLSWFTKAQQICSSLEILGLGTQSAKMSELSAFVNDYAEDEKILIFSRFHEMTKIVCQKLRKYDPLHLHGGVSQNKRQPLVDAFQLEPGAICPIHNKPCDHRLFVSTLKAGGVGLTLTAATIVARLDRWVSPTANQQAEDRTHRIGQTNEVTVVDFVVKDSIEERIEEMLEKKLAMIKSLISADDDGEMQERKIIRALLRSGRSSALKLI